MRYKNETKFNIVRVGQKNSVVLGTKLGSDIGGVHQNISSDLAISPSIYSVHDTSLYPQNNKWSRSIIF